MEVEAAEPSKEATFEPIKPEEDASLVHEAKDTAATIFDKCIGNDEGNDVSDPDPPPTTKPPPIPPLPVTQSRASTGFTRSQRGRIASPPQLRPMSFPKYVDDDASRARAAAARSNSAPRARRDEEVALTPRARRATKLLWREITQVKKAAIHMRRRVEQTHVLVTGVIAELEAAADGAATRLADNRRTHALTQETRDGARLPSKDSIRGPGGAPLHPPRKPNEHERKEIAVRLRAALEEKGEERDPTPDEIYVEIMRGITARKVETDSHLAKISTSARPIVAAVEKLEKSSRASAKHLMPHAETLKAHVAALNEIAESLNDHEVQRDNLFDPVKGNEKIENSVLYQKMNTLSLPAPLAERLNADKDPEEKSAMAKNRFGTTGHEATFIAAATEDTARADITKAMHAVQAAQVELARRKSAVQLSVRGSRQVVTEQRRATTRGNFGSAERRVTDPIRRKMALTPEDERN